jgi:AcrR family transcriptional regulator
VALSNDLSASMGDVAARIGISRTTLHRRFSSRAELTAAVVEFALAESRRIYDEAGIDDRPIAEALDALADNVLDLAVAYRLLWAEPPIAEVAGLKEEWEADDARLQRFAQRGQAEGVFRADVPAVLVGYSIGSHAFSLLFAVDQGYIGVRAVKQLFLAALLEGLGDRS